MITAPFRFVHLTDTHIIAGGTWRPRSGNFEFDTAASLRRGVEAVRHLDPAPAIAVLGGDLASPDVYGRDREIHLLHLDRAHTEGDVIVYLPKEKPAPGRRVSALGPAPVSKLRCNSLSLGDQPSRRPTQLPSRSATVIA